MVLLKGENMILTIVLGGIGILICLSVTALSVVQIPRLWRWGKMQWEWDTSVGFSCKSGPTEKLFAILGVFWGSLLLLIPIAGTVVAVYGLAVNI